jgi:hypothetical protein
MKMVTESYLAQKARWPASGKHVLAQFDGETVVVYQAYRPSIGHYAVAQKRLGGPEFSFGRMSWIKPNFLWMMYRSSWGTKQDQEINLAIRLKRAGFDEILRRAVHSSYDAAYGTHEDWKRFVAESDVRLQWDPDHGPDGAPLERRAIQLGLRGQALERFARDWTVDIEDVSPFVAEQRAIVEAREWVKLMTPREDVYEIAAKE